MTTDFKSVRYQNDTKSWEVFPEVCKSCGLCIEKCPQKCLKFDKDRNEYLGNPLVKCEIEKCISCGICQNICPEGAIIVKKES